VQYGAKALRNIVILRVISAKTEVRICDNGVDHDSFIDPRQAQTLLITAVPRA